MPYELFKILKQESDEAHFKADDLQDGVLIKSMKQGNLECAGRTLIASTYLQGQNIEHVVVSAPGHALLIIEQPSDTLIYFDANNNLYFTFPKSALDGYQGTGVLAECRLKEFTPREIDVADGISTAYSHFISMPAKEGVGRQYLGNVAAALKGNKEFVASGIGVDEEASQAVRLIENEIYGENKVFDNFYSKIDQLKKIEELQIADERKIVDEIMRDHSTHDDFITFFVKVLDGNMANRIPYIKNASLDNKKAFAEKLWNYIQKRNVK